MSVYRYVRLDVFRISHSPASNWLWLPMLRELTNLAQCSSTAWNWVDTLGTDPSKAFSERA